MENMEITIKDDYDRKKIAEEYDAMQPDYPTEVRQEIIGCLDKNASLGAGRRFMLDVGCGGGKSTQLFTSDFEQILGIDVSQSQIEFARRNVKQSNVEFQVILDNTFPVESKSTDLVFCGIALHYLDAKAFLRECDRVLVPGGILACIVFGPYTLKSLNGRFISDHSSKWKEVQREYIMNCGTNETMCETHLSRYEDIFNSIKNPRKRRECIAEVDVKFTVKSFLRLMSTILGYATKSYPDPKKDPLNILRDRLIELFQEAGLNCDDDTGFIVTFGFWAMIIEKTNEFGIA